MFFFLDLFIYFANQYHVYGTYQLCLPFPKKSFTDFEVVCASWLLLLISLSIGMTLWSSFFLNVKSTKWMFYYSNPSFVFAIEGCIISMCAYCFPWRSRTWKTSGHHWMTVQTSPQGFVICILQRTYTNPVFFCIKIYSTLVRGDILEECFEPSWILCNSMI